MNRFDHQWQKLTALARTAPDDRPATAPYGFATRLVAQAANAPAASPWVTFERFTLRGLVVAATCGLAAVVFEYAANPSEQSDAYAATDTVGEMLDFS